MDLYPNPTWAAKVHKMPDSQVYAIWCKKREEREYHNAFHVQQADGDWPIYHQMNVWEWLNQKEDKNEHRGK